MSEGYPLRPLGDVMRLDVERTSMEAGTKYRLAGVLNAGQGLIDRAEFDGADTDYPAMNVLRSDQVVMRKLTAWEGPITVVPDEFDGYVVSNEFPTFALGSDVAAAWMRLVCSAPRLWAEMKSRVSGTVQRRKRLNPSQLLQIEFPIPPLAVQERIVEVIGAVDDQIAALAAEATSLEALALGTAEDLLRDEPRRVLDGYLLEINGGRSPQAESRPPKPGEEGVLKVSAVAPFRFLPNESKALKPGTVMPAAAKVCAGDVLITRANTPARVGAVARVPTEVRGCLYLSDKTLRLVPAATLDPDYLVVAMALRTSRDHLTGSATGTSASMFNISQGKIRATPIPVPSDDIQHRVAKSVMSVQVGAATKNAELDRLRAVRLSLLSALLNGEVEVAGAL